MHKVYLLLRSNKQSGPRTLDECFGGSFSNVAPNKSQTISAPDHRITSHAEFNIISATGIKDAYAKID